MRLVCSLLLLVAFASASTWTEVGDAEPPVTPCPCPPPVTAGRAPVLSPAQNTKAAATSSVPYLEKISGVLSSKFDIDTYTFATNGLTDPGASVTLSLAAPGVYGPHVAGNDPGLFVFRANNDGSFTALVASRLQRDSPAQPYPSVTLTTPCNRCRYMVAITSFGIVPTTAGSPGPKRMWPPQHTVSFVNTGPGFDATSPFTLSGWTVPSSSPNVPTGPATYELSISFTGATVAAAVFGDPHFIGYLGQRFEFQGRNGSAYQLYSDDNLAVNIQMEAWTGPANKVAPNSTVIGSVGVFAGAHVISMNTASFNSTDNSVTINVGSSRVVLSAGHATTTILGCVSLELRKAALMLKIRDYEVLVSWHYRSYNSRYFLDVDVDLPERVFDGIARGGVLGQTVANRPPSIVESEFLARSLFTLDAKTNRYTPDSTLC